MSDRRLSHRDVQGARAAPREPTDDREPLDIGLLNEHLGYFIRRLQVWVFQDFIRTLAPVDIRPAQYSVLVVIAANPGLSQSDRPTGSGSSARAWCAYWTSSKSAV